jgi:chitodextrinase
MYKSLRELGSMIIDIKGNRLDALFLRENGSTPDTFSIVKSGTTPDDPTTNIAFQNDNLPNTNYNGTSDAYIAQANVNNNHGSATELLLDGDDGAGNDLASLIRWEMTNFVPTGATIDSASLTFDIFNSSGSSYEIYALKRAWNESQVTWNQADNANNWQSAGANGGNDRNTPVLGSVTATSTGSLTTNFNTAGLAVIQQWINNPSSNYGIIIANTSSGDGVDFYSSEFSTQTSRPKLSLSYHSDNGDNGDNNDTEAPTIPNNLNASNITSNSVVLNWDASTDNVAIKNYRIYRDDVQIDTTTNTSYTDNNLTAETIYRYKVSAVDTSDNESTQSTSVEATTSATQDTEAPTIPSNLNASDITRNSVLLSWDASTDNVAIKNYRIYRDDVQIDTTTNTSYTDNNLTAETTYRYEVSAVDTSDNESTRSTLVEAITSADTTPTQGTAMFQNGNFPDSSYNGTNDAYISVDDPNNNQGNATDLLLDGDGNGLASLIRWEIASSLPTGAVIDSASITIQVFNTSGESYEIYALKREWTDVQTTWNQANNSNNWQSAGADGTNDRDTQVLGSVDANSSGSLTITFNAAGLAAIQQWIDNPSSNYGIIIANSDHGDGVGFYSSEFGTLTSRPMLSLDYHTN